MEIHSAHYDSVRSFHFAYWIEKLQVVMPLPLLIIIGNLLLRCGLLYFGHHLLTYY